MSATRCPYCGSRRLAVDPARGTLVCQDCGSVVEELLIDDTRPPVDAIEYRPRRKKLILPIQPVFTVHEDKSSHEELKCIKKMIKDVPGLAARSPHLVTAMAYIIGGVSAGLPLTKSLSIARLKTGARIKTLYSLVRRYRSQIHEIAERVRRECREELSILLG